LNNCKRQYRRTMRTIVSIAFDPEPGLDRQDGKWRRLENIAVGRRT
jgi:hypothetical protein